MMARYCAIEGAISLVVVPVELMIGMTSVK